MSTDDDEPPTQVQRDRVDEMLMLRGNIVMAFAQIEFALVDVLIKARALPEYYTHTFKLPFRVEEKVQRFKSLFEQPGPLNAYCDNMILIADHFATFRELRNAMAHGLTHYNYTEATDIFSFRVIRQAGRDHISQELYQYRLARLRTERFRIVVFTHSALILLADIYARFGFEIIWASSGAPWGWMLASEETS